MLTILCAIALLRGCDSGNNPSSPPGSNQQKNIAVSGGTYRRALTQNPASLDPARVHHNYDLAVVVQLFDGLVRFDPDLSPRPSLARTWRIEEDGRHYLFELHPQARFHDGRPVTGRDVVFSLTRLLRIDPPPAILPHLLKIEGARAYRDGQSQTVAGLHARRDGSVEVRLAQAHAPFLSALGMYHAMIVPRHAVQKDPQGFGRQPVGSGPFRFVSWKPGQSILLERFDAYYAGASHLDAVRFKIYSGQRHQNILDDFLMGKLEEMPVFSDAVRKQLEAREDVQWFHRPSLSLFFYGVNNAKPPLNDPALRRKLSLAVDRLKLVETVYNGRFEIARTILPPGMPGYRPPVEGATGNSADGAMPAPAGSAAQPVVVEIVSAYDSPRVRAEMEMMRAFWRPIGVALKTKYITDWDAFNAYLRSDAVQMYRYVWFADMPDPDSMLHPLFASDSADNFMRFQDPQVDRLLSQARSIGESVRRGAVYREAEAYILKSAPLIPLFHLSIDQVYRSGVHNMRPSALGAHTMSLHRVWLDHQ